MLDTFLLLNIIVSNEEKFQRRTQ